MKRLVPGALVVGAIAAIAACGSVPDLHFVPDDAGTNDAGHDTGVTGDGGSSGADGSTSSSTGGIGCPNTPPKNGICCGMDACINCSANSCGICNNLHCTDQGKVCCKSGPGNGNIDCRLPEDC